MVERLGGKLAAGAFLGIAIFMILRISRHQGKVSCSADRYEFDLMSLFPVALVFSPYIGPIWTHEEQLTGLDCATPRQCIGNVRYEREGGH